MFIIWSKLGILALLLPVPFIFVTEMLMVPRAPAYKPPAPKSENEPEDTRTPEEIEQDLLTERLKREMEHERVVKKAKGRAYGVALLLGGAVLWPLGRALNRSEPQQFSDSAEVSTGGGHTLFFIPMEYWALFWAVAGTAKLLA